MCGITGFIDFKKTSSKDVLSAMTETLQHRGPDGQHVQFFNNSLAQIGLGHRRLAIIDLTENGTQPMQWQQYWLCFNGEIYNFEEIKSELKLLGHSFVGNSDSEVILHAYGQWGEECLHRFIGMFALIIYDTTEQVIFCARDRAGVKPFFYYFNEGLVLFASELKAFHQHPNFQKQLDKNAVGAFIQYGNVPTPHCIFSNCKKLKPGHSFSLKMTEAPASIEFIKQKQYWNVYDYYNKPKFDCSYAEALIETEQILTSAANYRMIADVPVGVFLSGGFDSTCVTALLQKDRTEKLKTFTIGVPDIGLNEAPYAKDIAKHLGTDHYEISCTEKEALGMIDELPYYFDEPFADSSAIPTTLVSKMAKEHVTVALSADGGDEIFAGYNRYDYLLRYSKKLNAIPGFARKSMVGIMNQIPSQKIPFLKHKYNFHNRYEKLKGVLRNPSDESIMLSLSQQFTNHQLSEIMKDNIAILETWYDSKELELEHYSPLSYMTAIDYQTYMLDDILQKVDRSTMTHSLEGREPFLDHRIIEFAAQLPDSFKYHQGIKKRILRDLTYNYVPAELLDRPKMGFAIPIANWLLNDLKGHVEEYISEDHITAQGIFDWTAIQRIKTDFYSGKKENDMKLWYVLMFQLWYAKWMN